MLVYGIYLICLCTAAQGFFLARSGKGAAFFFRGQAIVSGRMVRVFATERKEQLRKKEWVRRFKHEKIDREIHESISFLRNITALGRGRRVSADYVIEQLAQREGVLQQVYMRMLSFLRVGRKEEAAAMFSEEAETPMGKEFGGLLLQWDEIDPEALTEILISHQKNIKEVRMTIQKKRDEMISDLIYLPVVVNAVVIFINFIFVAYFMEQQEMLKMLF